MAFFQANYPRPTEVNLSRLGLCWSRGALEFPPVFVCGHIHDKLPEVFRESLDPIAKFAPRAEEDIDGKHGCQ